MAVTRVMKKVRLTKEQEEIRLRGLRILARMIVRHHLAVQARNGKESASCRTAESKAQTGSFHDMQEEGNDG